MEYAAALEKAWSELADLTEEKIFSIDFLSDKYKIDLAKRSVFSVSSGVSAKDYTGVIILHYLVKKLKLGILPEPAGEWISFKQLEGAEGYYPTFKKRVREPILKKYGPDPDGLLKAIELFPAKRIQVGDVGIVLEVFEDVPLLIAMWKGDEEFGPEVNISFDRSISAIFCTEDIIVLSEIIAHSL